MTIAQFDNLKVGDELYYYHHIEKYILKGYVMALYECDGFRFCDARFLFNNTNCETSLSANNLVFLTEKECMYFCCEHGLKEELRKNYLSKYPECFI